MKIGMMLNENETINNFNFAEAIYAECVRNDLDLNAEVVAKMILLQVEKGGEE
jgi:hypothetical protein